MALLVVTLVGCGDEGSPESKLPPDAVRAATAPASPQGLSPSTAKEPQKKATQPEDTRPAPNRARGAQNARARARLMGILRGARDKRARIAPRDSAPSPEVRILLDRLRRPRAVRPSPKAPADGQIEALLAGLIGAGR